MSNDGCDPVAWRGQAFSYLLHHPKDLSSQNYGQARSTAANAEAHCAPSACDSSSDTRARAGTGTWFGPAPRGQSTVDAAQVQEDKDAQVRHEPDFVLLPGGGKLPLIGYGTYGVAEAEPVRQALTAGYRHFDCATVYGNEHIVGDGLKDFIAEGRRSELFIVGKVWNDSKRPAALRAACEKTISDLGCKYLDLYLIHWPDTWMPGSTREDWTADKEITLQQTWAAMEQLVDDGLVKYLGVANFSAKQVDELLAVCIKHRPVVNQVELHPLLAQRKLVGYCLRKGIHCVAYSPLGHKGANGLLGHPVLEKVAAESNKTPAQVALKWNVQRGVACIPKSSNPERLRANIEGMFDWRLSPAHKVALDAMDEGKRFVIPPFHTVWDDAEEGGALKPSVVFQY